MACFLLVWFASSQFVKSAGFDNDDDDDEDDDDYDYDYDMWQYMVAKLR